MDELVFLPVLKLKLQDLYDWSISTQKCKSNKLILTPLSSPRKDGISALRLPRKERGTMTVSNERDIALFRYKDTVYAIDEVCPHAGGPLHQGEVEDLGDNLLCVKCPWHGWKFDLRTGSTVSPQGHKLQSTIAYPVRVEEGGQLYIGFTGIDQKYFLVEDNAF